MTGAAIREKLTGKLLALDPALERALPAFLTLLDLPVENREWLALDPAGRRQRTLDAIKRLLLRESQVQPLAARVRGSAVDRRRDAGAAR